MRAIRSSSVFVCGTLLAMTLWTGCGSDQATNPSQPAIASVSVTATNTTLTALGATAQLTAQARNAAGAVVPGGTFTWTSSDPTVATVSGTGLVTAVANGPFTISAVTEGVQGQLALTVAQAPASLSITTQPSGGASGAVLATQPAVTLLDANGNAVTNDSRTSVTAAIGSGSGTIGGTTAVTASAGVARFSDLVITGVVGDYTLSFSAPNVPAVASDTITIVPGAVAAQQSLVSVSPDTIAAGQTGTLSLQARDGAGNNLTSGGLVVSFFLSGGTSAGTIGTVTDAGNGTYSATFTALTAGTPSTVGAVIAGDTVTSALPALTVLGGSGTRLAFSVQPTDAIAGQPVAPAVVVSVTDTLGNPAIGFTGDITLALGANPWSGTLAGTLTRTAVAGIATFTDVALDKVGSGYTLIATAVGVNGATSNPFAVAAAPASELAFTVQPATGTAGTALTPAVTVQAFDPFGNTATGFSGSVTIALAANPGGGTLGGTTTVTAASGTVTFTDLTIDRAVPGYTLAVTAAGLIPDTSAAFDISPGAAVNLVLQGVPSLVETGTTIAPALQVTAFDGFGNVATGFTGGVTLSRAAGPAGTLSGTTLQQAQAGVASFADISLNLAGLGYRLAATATGVLPDTSSTFAVTPVGTTIYWTGAMSSDWSTAANWNTGTPPAASDNVFIPAETALQPVLAANVTTADLFVADGADLQTAGFTLTASGDVRAGNSITGTGTLVLTGAGVTLSGSLPNVTVLDSAIVAGRTLVGGNLTVFGRLTLNGNVLAADSVATRDFGVIVMQNPGDTLTVMRGMNWIGGNATGLLTDGVIQSGGDFNATAGYRPSGRHLLRFNGVTPQTVNAPHLHNVEFANLDSVTFVGGGIDTIAGTATVTQGRVTATTSAVMLLGDLVDLAGGRWQVSTTLIAGTSPSLPDSMNIQLLNFTGTVALAKGFTLAGNMQVEEFADLDLNGRQVTVNGNLQMRSRSILRMQSPLDTLTVSGDISNSTLPAAPAPGRIIDGVMEVGGNFNASGWYRPSGQHLLRFNGTTPQTVNAPYLHNVEFANLDSVTFVGGGIDTIAGTATVTQGRVTATTSAVMLLGDLVDMVGLGWRVDMTLIAGAAPVLPDSMALSQLRFTAATTPANAFTLNGNMAVASTGALVLANNVTLTGNLDLEGQLTVPAGIILAIGQLFNMFPASVLTNFGTITWGTCSKSGTIIGIDPCP